MRNNKNETVGIFTDGDIKRTIQKRKNFQFLRIKQLMKKSPISIDKETLAAKAISIMNQKKITSLCIHSKKNLKKTIGILHVHSLINENI